MEVAFAVGAVTRLRREFKLVLPEALAARLSGTLERLVAPTCTQVTSVYFDRPGFPLTARALSSPADCIKLRTKEYFPDVGERAARVVLEAKRERNGLTQKQRAWVWRSELRALQQDGTLWDRLQLTEGRSLMPVLAVTYERRVFQQEASWRVTVDRDVSFYAITAVQAFSAERLGAQTLGPPVAREERVIVEVKHLGEELPEWLLLLREGSASRFSKFGEGMMHLQQAHVGGVTGG